MRYLIIPAVVLAICFEGNIADASILGDMLTFDGNVNFVNDNSAGLFTDTNADTVPDLVQGVVFIDSVADGDLSTVDNVFARTGGSLFAIFSFSLTPVGGGVFTGAAAATPNSAEELLKKGGVGGADFSGLSTRNAAIGTPAILIIEAPGSFTDANWNNGATAGSPLSLEFDPDGSGFLADFSAFDVVMTLGFDGIDDNHTITIDVPATPEGTFSGVYSVAEDIFSPSITYKPLTGIGGTGDVIINDGNIAAASDTGADDRGFNFSDGGTYQIAPTPEPMSLLVWTILVSVVGLVARLRR